MDASTLSPAILLVDDDPPTLRMLSYTARKVAPTATILTAHNGHSALAHVDTSPIRLLITDYLLPDMDGLQLAAAVRRSSPQTYVIVTSADDSTALKQRVLDQHIDTVSLETRSPRAARERGAERRVGKRLRRTIHSGREGDLANNACNYVHGL